MDDTVTTAIVSAVVATGVTLLVTEITKRLNNQTIQGEVNTAWQSGREQGYEEGRQSVLWQESKPTKLSAVQ